MTACLATESEQMSGMCARTKCLQHDLCSLPYHNQVNRCHCCESRATTNRLLLLTSWPPHPTNCLLSLLMRLVLPLRHQSCHPPIAVIDIVAGVPDQLSPVTAGAPRLSKMHVAHERAVASRNLANVSQ